MHSDDIMKASESRNTNGSNSTAPTNTVTKKPKRESMPVYDAKKVHQARMKGIKYGKSSSELSSAAPSRLTKVEDESEGTVKKNSRVSGIYESASGKTDEKPKQVTKKLSSNGEKLKPEEWSVPLTIDNGAGRRIQNERLQKQENQGDKLNNGEQVTRNYPAQVPSSSHINNDIKAESPKDSISTRVIENNSLPPTIRMPSFPKPEVGQSQASNSEMEIGAWTDCSPILNEKIQKRALNNKQMPSSDYRKSDRFDQSSLPVVSGNSSFTELSSYCCGEDLELTNCDIQNLKVVDREHTTPRRFSNTHADDRCSGQPQRYVPPSLRTSSSKTNEGITKQSPSMEITKRPLTFNKESSPLFQERRHGSLTLCGSSERYVDTHCHWDFIFDALVKMNCHVYYVEDLERIFPDAFPSNFRGCIPNIIDPNVLRYHSDWVEAIVQSHYTLGVAYGCHPNKASQWNEGFARKLEETLRDRNKYGGIAVGEFGLDFYKMGSSMEKQLEALRGQAQIANRCNLPVVIHCRGTNADDCEDLCLNELKAVLHRKHPIHRHCFSETVEVAEKWVEAFPNVKFGLVPKNLLKEEIDRIRNLVKSVGLERILIETDSPFFRPRDAKLSPHDSPPKISMPGYVVYAADMIAQVLDMHVDKVLKQVNQNAQDLYRFDQN